MWRLRRISWTGSLHKPKGRPAKTIMLYKSINNPLIMTSSPVPLLPNCDLLEVVCPRYHHAIAQPVRKQIGIVSFEFQTCCNGWEQPDALSPYFYLKERAFCTQVGAPTTRTYYWTMFIVLHLHNYVSIDEKERYFYYRYSNKLPVSLAVKLLALSYMDPYTLL